MPKLTYLVCFLLIMMYNILKKLYINYKNLISKYPIKGSIMKWVLIDSSLFICFFKEFIKIVTISIICFYIVVEDNRKNDLFKKIFHVIQLFLTIILYHKNTLGFNIPNVFSILNIICAKLFYFMTTPFLSYCKII